MAEKCMNLSMVIAAEAWTGRGREDDGREEESRLVLSTSSSSLFFLPTPSSAKMSEPTLSTSSSPPPPPAHPLAQQEGYPFSSSALDTQDATPPPSNPTSPIHSPPRSPRHSSSYPNKARPLSPRPTSQSMAGVISTHNTANSTASQKKKHRASFDVHLPTIGLLSAAGGPYVPFFPPPLLLLSKPS